MTSEIRNESSGWVAGNNVQIGTVHGNVAMPGSAGQVDLDPVQAVLMRNLANEVRAASKRELRTWGIRERDALSVHWYTASAELFDDWQNIQDSAEPVSLAGQFSTIRETYAAVTSQRLMILGRAGAGKTVLAHQLIDDLLDKPSGWDIGPVPVLFSLGDWHPTTSLSSWLAQHLVRDFPFMEKLDATTGRRQADLFVDHGLVLPVLDGFDEIPESHHHAAVGQISSLDLPLVITSRPEEYIRAAHATKTVGSAAAIALEPLTLDETHRYLRHSTNKNRAPAWDTVFERLRMAPDEIASKNLTTVLTAPLMVMLARTFYNAKPGHQPDELLDSEQFPSITALENHLLDAYLETLYNPQNAGSRHPRLDPDRARTWLSYLATHLQQRNTHDLTWWHLHATLSRRTRRCAAGLALGLVLALPYGLFSGIAAGHIVDAFTAIGVGLFTAGLTPVMGLLCGFTLPHVPHRRKMQEPERLRLSLRRRDRAPHSWAAFLKRIAYVFSFVFALGFMLGFTGNLLTEFADPSAETNNLPMELTLNALAFGLIWGILLGIPAGVIGILSTLGDTHDPHAATPWTLLAQDRTVALIRTVTTTALVALLIAGAMEPIFGLIGGITPKDGDVTDSTGFIVMGLILGFLSGGARLAISSWGHWLLFARLWLPLTGRLPWRPKRFLKDAHTRGILRQAGAAYQFRHAQLRDHLANQTQQHHNS